MICPHDIRIFSYCSNTWLTRKEVWPDDDTSEPNHPPDGNLLCSSSAESQKRLAWRGRNRQTLWPPGMECWRMTSRQLSERMWAMWNPLTAGKKRTGPARRPETKKVREEGVEASHSDHYWSSREEASSQVQHNREVVGLLWVFAQSVSWNLEVYKVQFTLLKTVFHED